MFEAQYLSSVYHYLLRPSIFISRENPANFVAISVYTVKENIYRGQESMENWKLNFGFANILLTIKDCLINVIKWVNSKLTRVVRGFELDVLKPVWS